MSYANISKDGARRRSSNFEMDHDGRGAGGDSFFSDRGARAPAIPRNTSSVQCFNIDIRPLIPNPTVFFMALSGVYLLFSLMAASLQESVFHIPNFSYHGWMTFLNLAMNVLCAGFELSFSPSKFTRKAELYQYCMLAVVIFLGTYFTNWSLNYLSYPLRVLFKAIKIVPTMIISRYYVGKRYSWLQYFSVCVLAGGIASFSMGDAEGEATKFSLFGLLLITAGLVMDSFVSNYEEKDFFSIKCSPAEVLFWSSLFGSGMSFVGILMTGELWPAFAHSMEHPSALIYCMIFSCMTYLSSNLAMVLIAYSGATTAEIVKSMRKIVTIVASFVMFSRPWHLYHIIGFGCFVISTGLHVYDKNKKTQVKGHGEAILRTDSIDSNAENMSLLNPADGSPRRRGDNRSLQV